MPEPNAAVAEAEAEAADERSAAGPNAAAGFEPLTEAAGISLRTAEQFLFHEARCCDEHRYDEWEALWTDDAIYWVPANGEHGLDPDKSMSIIYDNRSRISTRIKQFHTGKRHSQTPPSDLRRVISNVELDGEEDGEALVSANFIIFESRERGLQTWAGQAEYRLRPDPEGSDGPGAIRMARKKVTLVDNDRAIYTLSFLV